MITLTMDATLFMSCDPVTGRVVRLTIQPALSSSIMVMDEEDATDEQVRDALKKAVSESWIPLTHLPDDIIWEGDDPWG